MTQQQIYDDLKVLAEQMGLVVRMEMGDFDGGICVLKERKVILLNRRHDIARRINVIARSLHRIGLGDVFVKPALRELIDDEVARAGTAQ
jgi:hypothetical protein